MATYEGLSADDFADIDAAVAEAMALVVLPVSFWAATPAGGDVDAMYGEATDGAEGWTVFGGQPIRASVKLQPTDEELTRYGLLTGAALLGFIPEQHVKDWAQLTGIPFAPRESMEVEYMGVRYNIKQLRTDWLPVGDGSTVATIGRVFTAQTKPSKLK